MLTVMTGPCVLEDMDTVLKIAEKLRPLSLDKIGRASCRERV